MSESKATDAEKGNPEVFESVNQWFLSLPAERQAILRDDKWMLAEAAFAQGRVIGRQEADDLIKYSYVALREKDETTWGGKYFEASGCAYAHDEFLSNAYRAKSVEALHTAMVRKLCDYAGTAQAIGRYSILKIARGKIVETVASGVVPIALKAERMRRDESPLFVDPFDEAYRDISSWVWSAARPRAGRGALEFAWHSVCAASHILQVELPSEAFASPDGMLDEVEHALDQLSAAFKKKTVYRDAPTEVKRLAAVLLLSAEMAGVTLTGKGFVPAKAA